MAFLIEKSDKTIKVICRKDSAITADELAYDEYLKDLDESKLKLSGEPTRFELLKSLPYDAQQHIKSMQVSVEAPEKGKKVRPKFNMGYTMEEIRCALVDIKNPDIVPADQRIEFKRHSDGYAAKELIALLEDHGIVSDLMVARTNVLNPEKGDQKKD
jgi:hypothetical protein